MARGYQSVLVSLSALISIIPDINDANIAHSSKVSLSSRIHMARRNILLKNCRKASTGSLFISGKKIGNRLIKWI